MRVIIAGSRSINDINMVKLAINESGWKDNIHYVVSGRARGVDSLGEECAKLKGWSVALLPANWDRLGKQAGLDRNKEMARYADALIAVWDGESRGTGHMVRTMERLGKPVFVFRTDKMAGEHINTHKKRGW